MPRLFTGLEIPASHSTTLSLFRGGVDGIRWIEPSDFHITLRFMGDVSPSMANNIVEALSSQDWIAPEIALGELKAFGGNKPTSLYASVKDTPELSQLARSQERLMQQIGLKADTRKFTPHVTLGRCRGVSPERIAFLLSQQVPNFDLPTFTAHRLVLYSARESTGGGPYRIEQTWPLIQKAELSDQNDMCSSD